MVLAAGWETPEMDETKRVKSMSKPLVSIITPCYNGERYLMRYFNSILQQTYAPLELIFVNDGSTDRTAEIAESYRDALEQKGIRYIYLYQENAGQAAALNRGLKLFTGAYLTWPDADDEMTPDCIEKKVEYLEKHPDIRMVRTDGCFVNEHTGEETNTIAKESDKSVQDIFEKLLLVKTYGCCGCYMISRTLLLESYPNCDFFESRVGQNWQILVPAASRSLCGYIDACLYRVYEHEDSHSRQKRTVQEMYQRLDMFAEVLHHATEVSVCDKTRARRLIAENNAREKFYYAVSVRDREVLTKTIWVIMKNGKITLKEFFLYLKCMMKG